MLAELISTNISSDIHTIVHLGSGNCRELTEYLEMNPQRIVLVEADPDIINVLSSKSVGYSNVEIRHAVIAGRRLESKFYIYNFPDMNSLRPATGLLTLFPGLRVKNELNVETILADTLLSDLDLNCEYNNLLVIDVPGEEEGILERLTETYILYNFKTIILSCGRQPLYQGNREAEAILSMLRDNWYEVVESSDEPDPDKPSWKLMRDDMALKTIPVRERVTDLTMDERQRHLEEELTEARRDLSISLKLQSLRESDLKELQERYHKAIAIQEEQQSLLEKLAEKLEIASDYYHKLEDDEKKELDKQMLDDVSKYKPVMKTKKKSGKK